MIKRILLLTFLALSIQTSAQEITMFNGFFDFQYYQDDERIQKKELVKLLETNPESIKYWKQSKTLNTLAWVSLASELGFFVWEIADNKPFENEDNNTLTQVGVFGSAALAITFALLSNSKKKKAVLSYNKSLEPKTTFRLQPSKKGIGLALVF